MMAVSDNLKLTIAERKKRGEGNPLIGTLILAGVLGLVSWIGWGIYSMCRQEGYEKNTQNLILCERAIEHFSNYRSIDSLDDEEGTELARKLGYDVSTLPKIRLSFRLRPGNYKNRTAKLHIYSQAGPYESFFGSRSFHPIFKTEYEFPMENLERLVGE